MKRILIIAHKKKQLKVYMVWLDMLQLQQHASQGRQVPWMKLGTKQGCKQLNNWGGGGGGTNKIKTKELQFGSRGRVQEGICPLLHKVGSKNFPRGVREQIRVIFK